MALDRTMRRGTSLMLAAVEYRGQILGRLLGGKAVEEESRGPTSPHASKPAPQVK